MNSKSPEIRPANISRRQFTKILSLTIASVACSSTEAAAMRRAVLLPQVYSNFRQDSNPPTATPEPRPTATPTPETLETQLDRLINSSQTTDSAQETLNGKTYTFKMKVDPQAKYKFTMRPDLKQQAMHLIAVDGWDNNFAWDITFDEAIILGFARHNDIPDQIFHGAFPQGYTRRDGTKQASGFFGAKGNININGKKYTVVVFAPPEPGIPFDAENIEHVGVTLGLYLASATVNGYGDFDPAKPRLTREQLLKFDERNPIFNRLSILAPK